MRGKLYLATVSVMVLLFSSQGVLVYTASSQDVWTTLS